MNSFQGSEAQVWSKKCPRFKKVPLIQKNAFDPKKCPDRKSALNQKSVFDPKSAPDPKNLDKYGSI
jgi:hypothetical protein